MADIAGPGGTRPLHRVVVVGAAFQAALSAHSGQAKGRVEPGPYARMVKLSMSLG
jgi:hypothetical protein